LPFVDEAAVGEGVDDVVEANVVGVAIACRRRIG
jgi:hypothetical protein